MKHGKIALIAAGALLVAGGYAAGYVSAHAATSHAAQCRNGYVALTFDDGPDPASTPRLLDALRDAGIRATFFDIGQHVQAYPALVKQTVAYGNAVEDHTWDHRSLTGATTGTTALTENQVTSELYRAKQTIVAETGRQPAFFRSPYGDSDAAVQQAAGRLGMTEVGWTVDSRDYKGIPTDQVVANVLSVKPGGVVVMHDTAHTANTIAAIPAIAAGLRARGLCAGRLAPSAPGTSGWEHGVFHARPVKWPPQPGEK
ncbi:MAG TPA: polysaccharide deacetylase family protein [Jatrophihabitantaceae bacterium]|jgi:endo-1,4-beta-xylanase